MHIDWVIPCRYAEVHDNLGTIVGAGIDHFWMMELPSPLQVVMAIRLSSLPDEIVGKHHFRNIIRKPDGSTLAEQEAELDFQENEEGVAPANPDFLQGIMIQMVVVFEASVAGTYSAEFIVDKGSTYTVPLHVVHGPPPGMPAPE